jgi:Carboxypeptidase regulatory-like domain
MGMPSWVRNLLFCCCLFLPLLGVGQTATVRGTVKDGYNNRIDSVRVVAEPSGKVVYTDSMGVFTLQLPPGSYSLKLTSPNFKPATEVIKLAPAETKLLPINLGDRYSVSQVNITNNHNATDLEDPDNVGMSRVPIDPKKITQIPGFKSDISSRLMTLAVGVTSNNELSSQYRVRGGNFDENLVYVNDIEVYRPLLIRTGQQEGLGFVNPNLASDVGFSSGGFQAKYADKLSSVLDVTYTDPTALHGSAEMGILNQNFNIEGEVQKPNSSKSADGPTMVAGRFTYLMGARRFTPSYVLSSLDTKGEYKPRFTDVQGMFTYAPRHVQRTFRVKEHKSGRQDTIYLNKEKIKFSLFYNFASNEYIFTPVSRETSFGTVQNVLRLSVAFQGQDISAYTTGFGAFVAEHRPNAKLRIKYIATAFRTVEAELFEVEGGYFLSDVNTNLGSDGYNETVFDRGVGTFYRHGRNYLQGTVLAIEQRGDWIPDARYKHKITWGLRAQRQMIQDHVQEWNGTDSSGYFVLDESYRNDQQISSNLYKAFFQDHWKISRDNSKRLVIGARAIYNDLNNQFLFAPRLQFVIDPSSSDVIRATSSPLDVSDYARGDKRRYQIRFAAGVYQQPIFYREMRAFDGTLYTNRKAQTSYHAIAGGDYLFNIWGRPFKVTAEGYYKYLTNLVPYEVDNVRIRYYPELHATGFAYGLDTRITGQFIKGVDSWMTLGLLKTQEKVLELNQGYVPRSTDQRFQASMFFQDELPINPNYKAHINFVYGSGLRFGPPRIVDKRTVFQYPSYQRVDLGFSRVILINSIEDRSEKKFAVESLWISLELFNVFQRANTVSYVWIKDVFNTQFAVPNYLSARLLNLRVIARF